MNKQTFSIPDGCKVITMEVIDDKIVTTFEPMFKRGDVLISTCGDGVCVCDEVDENCVFEIVGVIQKKITCSEKPFYFAKTHNLRLATPKEAQRLWDALAKDGKRWNPETMEVEEIKKEIPRAEKWGTYWTFDFSNFRVFSSDETGNTTDKIRHEQGRYFLTKEQAKRAVDKLKQALAEFWEEELK